MHTLPLVLAHHIRCYPQHWCDKPHGTIQTLPHIRSVFEIVRIVTAHSPFKIPIFANNRSTHGAQPNVRNTGE